MRAQGTLMRARFSRAEPPSDAFKPKDKRSRWGQVETPAELAEAMVADLLRGRGPAIKILDPWVGPVTFPLALLRSGLPNGCHPVTAFDIDKKMVAQTLQATSM